LLGSTYEKGRGVPQDYAQAAAWYRKAADTGDADAQFSVALMYEKGEGVPQDYAQAHLWYNLSASRAPEAKGRAIAVEGRNDMAAKMTPAQIIEAQRLAREWKPSSRVGDAQGSEGAPSVSAAPESPAGARGETIVRMVRDGGTFVVPVTLNGQLTLKFVVDSGAADVSVPADVVMALLRTEQLRTRIFSANKPIG
jgi:TPR repeat protein